MSRSTSSHIAPPTPSLPTSRFPRRAALAALLLPLAACAGEPDGAEGEAGAGSIAPDGASDSAGATTDSELTITDPWVKAAEEGMTSAFATFTNSTDQDLVLIGASTPASAHVELHETTSDGSGGTSMQEKEGGFPLSAGGELILEPGGNHLMLIELTTALLPGDEVELILEFDGGTEHGFTATVKDFAGAQEHYVPEGSSGSDASDSGGGHEAGHGDEHEGEQ